MQKRDSYIANALELRLLSNCYVALVSIIYDFMDLG